MNPVLKQKNRTKQSSRPHTHKKKIPQLNNKCGFYKARQCINSFACQDKNGAGGRLELLNNQLDLINTQWAKAKENVLLLATAETNCTFKLHAIFRQYFSNAILAKRNKKCLNGVLCKTWEMNCGRKMIFYKQMGKQTKLFFFLPIEAINTPAETTTPETPKHQPVLHLALHWLEIMTLLLEIDIPKLS